MDDSEQVDFILQHTPEPERGELAESFRSGQMTVDEFIFGEDDDAAIRQAAATTAGGCALLITAPARDRDTWSAPQGMSACAR